jgi:uncharacterized protein (TIGR03089 family)
MTHRGTVPSQVLAAALRRAPAAPLVTAYDDARDERVELSATTFGNWVAKSANLLRDEFDVAPGSTVAVALPVHWQTAAVLLAVWSCGATVLDTAAEDDGRLAGADVVLAGTHRLPAVEEALGDDGPPLLGLSLHPLGLGLRDYAGGARDFALEVRGAADVFVPFEQPDPGAPGLLAGGLELTLGGLVATAEELAGRLGITGADRVLVDGAAAAEAGPVAWLLAPLVAGASIVLCRAARPDRLPRRAEEERVTATLGAVITGVRELGRPA